MYFTYIGCQIWVLKCWSNIVQNDSCYPKKWKLNVRFPGGSKKKKCNNSDKHGHGQEKETLNIMWRAENINWWIHELIKNSIEQSNVWNVEALKMRVHEHWETRISVLRLSGTWSVNLFEMPELFKALRRSPADTLHGKYIQYQR